MHRSFKSNHCSLLWDASFQKEAVLKGEGKWGVSSGNVPPAFAFSCGFQTAGKYVGTKLKLHIGPFLKI